MTKLNSNYENTKSPNFSVDPKMAPEVGLEPTTDRLTADCSTIELLWNPEGVGNL
jgi:hypothetical protein